MQRRNKRQKNDFFFNGALDVIQMFLSFEVFGKMIKLYLIISGNPPPPKKKKTGNFDHSQYFYRLLALIFLPKFLVLVELSHIAMCKSDRKGNDKCMLNGMMNRSLLCFLFHCLKSVH